MAIVYKDKVYRNLVEQVLKNKEDIDRFAAGTQILADFGIKVIGHVDDAEDLPNPAEYEGDYGDAYTVGANAPYNFYIFTRPQVGEEIPSWFNIGEFPKAGPQGIQGETGPQGIQGIANNWYTGTNTSSVANPIDKDLYLITSGANIGNVYQYSVDRGDWSLKTNIIGPQGIQGPKGDKGNTGDQGPQGNTGPQGNPGQAFTIIGTVASEELLPDASSVATSSAYLVGESVPYYLYVIITSPSIQWFNVGAFNYNNVAIVQLTTTAGATTGTLNDDQYNTIIGNPQALIKTSGDGELYRLNDDKTSSGYLVYTNINGTQLKDFTITISTKGWVITTNNLQPELPKTSDSGKVLMSTAVSGQVLWSDDFATKTGYYEDMTVGTAEQLEASITNDDSVPYLYRTTGGNASIGDRVNEEIVGGSLPINQLVQNGNFANNTGWNLNSSYATKAIANGICTITYTNTAGGYNSAIYRNLPSINVGHKYLISQDINPSANGYFSFDIGNKVPTSVLCNANTWTRVTKIIEAANNVVAYFANPRSDVISLPSGTVVKVKNCMVIDLTQMYGSAIADYWYGLSNNGGVAKFKEQFPNDYYAYNTGALQHVNVLSKKVVGFNQWDGTYESGNLSSTTGEETTGTATDKRSLYIPVIGGATYYFKRDSSVISIDAGKYCYYDADKNFISSATHTRDATFVVPSNARYMRFAFTNVVNPTLMPTNLCINISWSGAHNGEYQPYEEHTYNMPSGDLYGILKLDNDNNLYYDGDIYKADGSITRKYGIVDLGTLTWEYASPSYMQATNALPLAKGGANVPANAVCAIYNIYPSNSLGTGLAIGESSKTVFVNGSGYTDAAAFKAAMSGVYLVYELATPTTDQGTPYQEIQIVDDWGTEEFITDDSIVPVGHNSKYLLNLRDKLQNLPENADSNGLYLVKQTGAQQSLQAYADSVPDITSLDNTKTYVLKCVNGVITWVEEE